MESSIYMQCIGCHKPLSLGELVITVQGGNMCHSWCLPCNTCKNPLAPEGEEVSYSVVSGHFYHHDCVPTTCSICQFPIPSIPEDIENCSLYIKKDNSICHVGCMHKCQCTDCMSMDTDEWKSIYKKVLNEVNSPQKMVHRYPDDVYYIPLHRPCLECNQKRGYATLMHLKIPPPHLQCEVCSKCVDECDEDTIRTNTGFIHLGCANCYGCGERKNKDVKGKEELVIIGESRHVLHIQCVKCRICKRNGPSHINGEDVAFIKDAYEWGHPTCYRNSLHRKKDRGTKRVILPRENGYKYPPKDVINKELDTRIRVPRNDRHW